MAKTRSQNTDTSDWNSYGYLYVHHFSRARAVWFLIGAVLMLGLGIWLAPHYLLDSSYHPVWSTPKCHGRRCGLGIAILFAIYLFLLMPIWLKAPIAAIVSSEAFLWLLTMLKFSFDRQPDFAIGPKGLYGLCRLHYYHVPWEKVGSIHLERRTTLLNETEILRIYTKVPCRPHWFWTRGKPLPVRLLFPPLAGLHVPEILSEIRRMQPERKIIEIKTDLRPWWLK